MRRLRSAFRRVFPEPDRYKRFVQGLDLIKVEVQLLRDDLVISELERISVTKAYLLLQNELEALKETLRKDKDA